MRGGWIDCGKRAAGALAAERAGAGAWRAASAFIMTLELLVRLLLRAACAKLGGPLSAAEAHAALTPKLDARRSQQLWLHFVKNGWVVGA